MLKREPMGHPEPFTPAVFCGMHVEEIDTAGVVMKQQSWPAAQSSGASQLMKVAVPAFPHTVGAGAVGPPAEQPFVQLRTGS